MKNIHLNAPLEPNEVELYKGTIAFYNQITTKNYKFICHFKGSMIQYELCKEDREETLISITK